MQWSMANSSKRRTRSDAPMVKHCIYMAQADMERMRKLVDAKFYPGASVSEWIRTTLRKALDTSSARA